MGTVRGRNAGVSGLFDFPGLSAQFTGTIHRWSVHQQGQVRAKRGRGGGMYRTHRWLASTGVLATTATMRGDGWPAPAAFTHQAGTVTITIHRERKVSYPVLVTAVKTSEAEDGQEWPTFALTAEITGEPVYTGWPGPQPAATVPSKANQEQWEGSSKTYDANSLQAGAVTLVDCWGTFNDNVAGETSLVATVLGAAVTPQTGLVVRTATFQRDALDGGTVQITWGLRDTKDDVEMPGTSIRTDAQNLASDARETLVHAPGSVPAAFTLTPPTGIKLIGKTTQEINRLKSATVLEGGYRDSAEAAIAQHTNTALDPLLLHGTATTSELWTDTPPATPTKEGYKLVNVADVPTSNPTITQRIYTWRIINTRDEIIFPGDRGIVSATANWTKHQRTIVNVTAESTPLSIAQAVHETAKSDVNYERVDAIKLTDTQALIDTIFAAGGKTHIGQCAAGIRSCAAAPTVSGLAVQVAAVIARGATWSHILIVPWRKWQISIDFTLSFRLLTTAPPYNDALLGTTNNAAFLGLASGTVTYTGVSFKTNIEMGTTRRFEGDYHFRFCNLGHWVEDGVPTGWGLTDATVSAGPVLCSTLGFSGAGMFGTGDYSGFLT
jgi:hypothetical protein